jgi:alpha-N-arabinofuranosidase
MAYIFKYLPFCASLALLSACQKNNVATFDNFVYEGNDDVYVGVNADSAFCNPILAGYYPDPSICKKGDTYYIVNSSFSHFPSIPIFKSTDLVNWEQLGYVINDVNALSFDSLQVSEGIFAPTIRYNPHNDTFYVITTCVQCGGNFIVKSKDPDSGVWSDPIWIPEVGGIDPSLFFDDDGQAYIVNNDAPQCEPRYEGHRAIWMHRYDTATDRVIGNAWVVVDGGIHPEENPIWIEGPHMYKLDGKYIIMAAEGGTSINHSEVVLISDSPEGKYTPAPINPILTQRDMPADRANPVTCTGHADLVQDGNGDYWAVFLGCRPYPEGYYNIGRETFLLPVQIVNGQPIILEQGKEVPLIMTRKPVTYRPMKPESCEPFNGNFSWTDDFSATELSKRYIFVRNVRNKWYNTENGKLNMTFEGSKLDSICNPHFIAFRQQHLKCSVSVDVEMNTECDGKFAGMAAFQNDRCFVAIGMTNKELVVYTVINGEKQIIASQPLMAKNLRLSISADNEMYTLKAMNGNEVVMSEELSGTFLSTDKAGGFVGTIIGMLAQEY